MMLTRGFGADTGGGSGFSAGGLQRHRGPTREFPPMDSETSPPDEVSATTAQEPEPEPERRREYRLNKVLGAVLGTGEDAFRARIFVINISRTGLKATHQVRVPDADSTHLQLFLSSKEPPLEIEARVAWQKELTVSGMFEIGFQFLSMSEDDNLRLEEFMVAETQKVEPSKPLDLSSPWKFGRTPG